MTVELTEEERAFVLMLVNDGELGLFYEARDNDEEETLVRLVESIRQKLTV